MVAKAEIISNNPDIEALVPKTFSFTGMEGSPAKAVLTAARDRIHLGAKLLAHPMAGRLRPNETPYMTVVLAPPAPSTGGPGGPFQGAGHRSSQPGDHRILPGGGGKIHKYAQKIR